jgi:hypothetical protein
MKLCATSVMVAVMMPGGYHYRENGKMIIDDAVSYEDLVNKLAEYRGFCGLPLGNPQADVDRYICTSFPVMCGGRMPEPQEASIRSSLATGNQW